MSSTQKAPLPGATIPWGTTGPWQPPAQYGKVTSPAINPKAGDWPTGGGTPPAALTPFFCTNLGINFQKQNQFVFFGTYGVDQDGKAGYLGNPYDQNNTYGAPSLQDMTLFTQETGTNNWENAGESFTVQPVPVPGSTAKTNQQLVAGALELLAQIKF